MKAKEMRPNSRRGATPSRMLIVMLLVAVIIILLYRLHFSSHAPVAGLANLAEREQRLAEKELRVEALMRATARKEREEMPSDGQPSSDSLRDQLVWECPVRARTMGLDVNLPPAARGILPCSGKGVCNTTSGQCLCRDGFAGYACDVALSQPVATVMNERRVRLDAALRAPSKAAPSDNLPAANQLLDAAAAGELVTVAVPFLGGTDGLLPLKHLVGSISQYYPQVAIIVSVTNRAMREPVETLFHGVREEGRRGRQGLVAVVGPTAGDGGGRAGGLAAAWNSAMECASRQAEKNEQRSDDDGLRRRPLLLFLAPDVVRFHEHTNLELAVSQMLTTDVDVLGFHTLAPVTDSSLAVNSPPFSDKNSIMPRKDGDDHGGEYLFISECWRLKHRQWKMEFDKPPFGHARHEQFVAYCDRTSNSFIVRRSIGVIFDAAMKDLAIPDFFVTIASENSRRVQMFTLQRRRTTLSCPFAFSDNFPVTRVPGYVMVGTCSECLLVTAVPATAPDAKGALSKAAAMKFDGYFLPPPLNERLHQAFAEKWQVELYVAPTGRIQRDPHTLLGHGPSRDVTALARQDLDERFVCTRSGGIYSHTQRGLFSPLCHRAGRQRDFAYLTALWTGTGSGNLLDAIPGRRYGVSLHHGNLIGALRMGEELLWETDGDFDVISFDDSHDDMMKRWDAFAQHARIHAGFEVTVTGKPWYATFKRNKTDFQINCRGVKSEQTRGKPPQVHNISVWYQGTRCYMNGFQNPWQSVRSDPGHDYRGQYLAQQGWVQAHHYAKQSIGCLLPAPSPGTNESVTGGSSTGVFAHNACLPSCSDPRHAADHNFCSMDETDGFSDWEDMRLVQFV